MKKMMKKSVYAIIASLTLAAAIGITLGSSSNTEAITDKSTSTSAVTEVTIENTIGAEAFLAQGGKAVISTKLEPAKLNLQRGGSADISMTITYIAGNQPHDTVTVWVSPERTILTPASLARNTTPEERISAIDSNQLILGMIRLVAFERFSENKLTLQPGESKTITMHVTIPNGIPEELIGDEIHFYPDIQVSPQQWTRVMGTNDLTVTISQ